MKIFEIPLNPYAEKFKIDIAGKSYFMRTHWNDALNCWTLDIGHSAEKLLICNLALVAECNLLMQHEYLNLGFELWVQVDGNPEGDVGIEGFGAESALMVVIR